MEKEKLAALRLKKVDIGIITSKKDRGHVIYLAFFVCPWVVLILFTCISHLLDHLSSLEPDAEICGSYRIYVLFTKGVKL